VGTCGNLSVKILKNEALVIAAIGVKDNHDFEVLEHKFAKIAQL
jgi:hypothetical protein